MMKFTVNKTPSHSASSIWSPDYELESLIPIEEAANSFPDGGRKGFVRWMKERCSITQDESIKHHLGVDDVWKKLNAAFVILCPIIYYEPVMRKFLRQLFKTVVEDGVRWLEIRTMFITLYLLEGQESPATSRAMDLAMTFIEEIENFKKAEPKFWGARFIWSSMRGGTSAAILDGTSQFTIIQNPSMIDNKSFLQYE